ncbi:MAG: T9SS type A sorting domain-containing protein, partial [Bacteroidales bacterium]|nr:T9SS type A sorting domain-containing protein [Bacteroidales bacterium]
GIQPDFKKVFFISSTEGWIAGHNGQIFYTDNGGTSWEKQTTGTYNDIYDIYFTDNQNGFAVGEIGLILKTVNSGNNWEVLNGPEGDFESVFFTSVNKGWIINNYDIYYTENGGLDWDLQIYPSCSYGTILRSLHFNDSLNGWICGDHGTLLHTSDGGNNWACHFSGTTFPLCQIAFSDIDNGVAIGRNGTILRTERGSYLAPSIIETANINGCSESLLEIPVNVIGDSLNYQWYVNNTMIIGSNHNPLIYDSATAQYNGLYQCEIWNDAGNLLSEEIMVSVHYPPEISAQPIDIFAKEWEYIYFNLAFNGTFPMYYQWQKNGTDIPGAEYMIYPIDSVTMADTGNYRCKLWNICGEVFTEEAKLTVEANPGVYETGLPDPVKIYPNPIKEVLVIELTGLSEVPDINITITGQKGNVISEQIYPVSSGTESIKINTTNLYPGIYLIKTTTSEWTCLHKIVKM